MICDTRKKKLSKTTECKAVYYLMYSGLEIPAGYVAYLKMSAGRGRTPPVYAVQACSYISISAKCFISSVMPSGVFATLSSHVWKWSER